jgi:hypothetical protein
MPIVAECVRFELLKIRPSTDIGLIVNLWMSPLREKAPKQHQQLLYKTES